MATTTVRPATIERSAQDVRNVLNDTEHVLQQLKARHDFVSLAWSTIKNAFSLRTKFKQLAELHDCAIAVTVAKNFDGIRRDELRSLADSFANVVAVDRQVLADASRVGAMYRFLWSSSLREIASQADHLDSIAESLYAASDVEAEELIAFAAERMASK
jgi:hypothetical protein